MSNCYTLFCEAFVPCSDEQREWLKNTIAIANDEEHPDREETLSTLWLDDTDRFLSCVAFLWQDGEVYISSDECGDVDDVLCLIAAAQRMFNDRRPWGLTWACTADRGPAKGGAAVVKDGHIDFQQNADHWLREQGVET